MGWDGKELEAHFVPSLFRGGFPFQQPLVPLWLPEIGMAA